MVFRLQRSVLSRETGVFCRQQKAAAAAKASVKQQGKRNAKLLSFDEEEEAEQNPLAQVKIGSYHDAVQDSR